MKRPVVSLPSKRVAPADVALMRARRGGDMLVVCEVIGMVDE
jgi:hypothetical protein